MTFNHGVRVYLRRALWQGATLPSAIFPRQNASYLT